MPRESKRVKADRRRFQPRLKVWLEQDGEYIFGHGLSEILQAVANRGSIKDAAESLGKSYRYVWGRLKKAERTIGAQLVETRVGGKESQRSWLTPLAEELTTDFVALRQRMLEVVEQEYTGRFRAQTKPRQPKEPRTK